MQQGSIKRKAIQSVKWNALSAASSVIVQLLRTIILARLLDPRDYGLMGMIMVVLGFAEAFTDAGIGNAIIHKQTDNRKVLSSLFWVNIALGVFVYVALSACSPLIALYFKEPDLISLSLVVFISILFRSVSRQFETLLAKDLQFKQIARVEMLSGALSLVVAILVALNGGGVWALVWSHITKVGIQGILQFLLNFERYRPSLHFDWLEVKPYLSFSLFQLGEINVRFIAQRFDQVLLARWLGPQSLGYYNFSYQLVILPVSRLNPIITRVAFPIFAKLQNDMVQLQRYYLKMIQLLSSLNAPILIGLATFSSEIIPLVFGPKWTESIALVQLFAIVTYAQSCGSPIGALLLARGFANIGFYMNLALFALNIPTVFLGVYFYGSKGAIMALIAVQLTLGLLIYFKVIRRLIGPCGKAYLKSWGIPLLLALLSAMLSKGIQSLVQGHVSAILNLCIALGIFSIVYLLLTKVFNPSLLNDYKQLKKGVGKE